MAALQPIIAVVRRETRLEGLKARWATARAAEFRMEQAVDHEIMLRKQRRARAGRKSPTADSDAMLSDALLEEAAEALAEPEQYEEEDNIYRQALKQLLHEIDLGFPIKEIDRAFLPNFDFGRCMLVVVIGPDGLVANTAKYAGDLPIIGINPDPARNDGVLLPFSVGQARGVVQRAIKRRSTIRTVTLAEVNTNEGQRLLAFNDFFVGCASHVSARYTLEVEDRMEPQSSSGILISTGAGSTGWLSSLFNMTAGFAEFAGGTVIPRLHMKWEDRRLVWAVREPFQSKHSQAGLVAGFLDEGDELVVGSQMPTQGVIFSDGVEADYLEFNSGTIARFSISEQSASLVVG